MKLKTLFLSASVLCVCAGAAQAQTVVSRTTDVAVTFDNANNFANASGFYGFSLALPEQTPFTGDVFNFQPLSNATGITFQSGAGGVTVTAPPPPYAPPATIPVTQNDPTGTAGSWSATYNTAATASGPLLTFSTLNGNNVLNFDGGGSLSSVNSDGSEGTLYDGIDFFVFVHLPGDWTMQGTAAGDLDYLGVGAGFSDPTFTFNTITDMTTVETFTHDYTDGESVGLDFDLIGGPAGVPEPAVWAMLMTGFFGVGAAMRRSRKTRGAAITA
jgi:hypothetical protein